MINEVGDVSGDGEDGVVGDVFGWWVCEAPISKSITANATSAVNVSY